MEVHFDGHADKYHVYFPLGTSYQHFYITLQYKTCFHVQIVLILLLYLDDIKSYLRLRQSSDAPSLGQTFQKYISSKSNVFNSLKVIVLAMYTVMTNTKARHKFLLHANDRITWHKKLALGHVIELPSEQG